jgi:precorrin-2 dehydrogenase/sirohydrochlorin ferrochelatase
VGRYFPLVLKLENQLCLVVGGSAVAERKTLSLLKSGAKVKLVSKEVTPRLHRLSKEGLISYRQGEYQPADLAGVFLVIGATGCRATNQKLAEDCRARNLLVSIVDIPEDGNFFMPAVLTRGSLQIAVSTSGKSPLLARKIRQELGKKYGPAYGELADLLGAMRSSTKQEIKDQRARHAFFARLLDREVMRLMQKGFWKEAKERIEKNVSAYCWNQSPDSTR